MITDDKVIEIYALANGFCHFFSLVLKRHQLGSPVAKRSYYREPVLSDAEVITILALFHLKGYRCLKHFYVDYVCKHMRHLFPRVLSYNRLVERQQAVLLPSTIFIKEVLLGECAGISFVGSAPASGV